MITKLGVELSDVERLAIAKSLGSAKMLSRKDVDELVQGFIEGLKGSAEIIKQPKVFKGQRKPQIVKKKPSIKASKELTKRMKKLKLAGKTDYYIDSYARGWNQLGN